jgi:hypothetical protein
MSSPSSPAKAEGIPLWLVAVLATISMFVFAAIGGAFDQTKRPVQQTSAALSSAAALFLYFVYFGCEDEVVFGEAAYRVGH